MRDNGDGTVTISKASYEGMRKRLREFNRMKRDGLIKVYIPQDRYTSRLNPRRIRRGIG